MPHTFDRPSTSAERGQRIQWARELVEPNRAEMARKLAVDTSTLRNIENGSRNPSYELLQRICHFLRVSLEYVVRGQLTGVDPELAALLAVNHPELLPQVAHKRGSARRGSRPSIPDPPRTLAAY